MKDIFAAIYSNESVDDIERTFIMINTQYEIDILRVNQNYMIESSLISFHKDDNIITEKSGSFSKFIKGLVDSIIHFIDNLINSFLDLFKVRDNVNTEDLLKSKQGEIKLRRDIYKLSDTIDDEIRKGNKLLHNVSSATGLTEKQVEEYIENGKDKILKIAPATITIASTIIARKKVSEKLQNKKNSVKKLKNNVNNMDNIDNGTEKLVIRVVNHISSLINEYGKETMNFIKSIK